MEPTSVYLDGELYDDGYNHDYVEYVHEFAQEFLDNYHQEFDDEPADLPVWLSVVPNPCSLDHEEVEKAWETFEDDLYRLCAVPLLPAFRSSVYRNSYCPPTSGSSIDVDDESDIDLGVFQEQRTIPNEIQKRPVHRFRHTHLPAYRRVKPRVFARRMVDYLKLRNLIQKWRLSRSKRFHQPIGSYSNSLWSKVSIHTKANMI